MPLGLEVVLVGIPGYITGQPGPPPPFRKKGLIAGLIKGKQWPDHKAWLFPGRCFFFLGGGGVR